MNKNDSLFERKFVIEGRDFTRAGKVSSAIKKTLKEIGFPSDLIKRVVVVAYEAEMNVVTYADKADLFVLIDTNKIIIRVEDEGPGIPDIDLAMQEGYSTAPDEIREMGFGAGMGLPNIKKNSDILEVTSDVGKGTVVHAEVRTD